MPVKSWMGDSKNAGITRSQDNATIKCESPVFDNYVCMTLEDILELKKKACEF